MPYKFICSLVFAATVLSTMVLAQSETPKSADEHKLVVETNDGRYGVGAGKVIPEQLGLAIYPGSKLAPSKDQNNEGKDNGAALFLDWGKDSTHLYVQKYVSSDSAEKIVAFYRKQLAKYGVVLECRGGKPVNADVAKAKCDGGDSDNDVQLKAGPETKQHIVGVTPTANGTEFAIVYLDRTKAEEAKE